jgi:plastocyanin
VRSVGVAAGAAARGLTPVRAVGIAAVAATLALGASEALAGGSISAVHLDRFTSRTLTIAQGQVAVLRNADIDKHNVTSDALGPGGRTPLFASATIGTGQNAAISGTQYLRSGRYTFSCTLHSFMHGTLVVTHAGHPRRRPGRSRR